MLRQLVKVMTGIVITLNDYRSVRRKTDVPADKTNLRNNHCSPGAHIYYLIPHRENEALEYGTCHGVFLIKNLSLINREIGDLTCLLINRRGHAAVIEIIHAVAIIAESAAGTGHMYLAFPLDSNDPYRIDRIGIDSAYRRVLNDYFLKEMRAFLIYQALIDVFGLLLLAVDLLDRLTAGSEICLCNKEIMAVNEV